MKISRPAILFSLPFFSLVAGSGLARSEDYLKKGAPIAKIEAKAAVVGKLASKDYQKSVLDHALEGISERADTIALFINDNGCRIEDGKKSAVTGADVIAKAKQIAPGVEVILLSPDEMRANFTGDGKVPWAAGMCSEGRAAKDYPLPGKKTVDALVIKTPDGKPLTVSKFADVMPGHTLAHELLHVLLTYFGNPALGGGEAKPTCVTSKKVANAHHRLTRHLLWGQFGGEWTAPATAPVCN